MRHIHFNLLTTLLASILILFSAQGFAAGGGGDSSYGDTKDEFSEVNKLIKAEKYRQAHRELLALDVDDREADRLNLLGFTARKSGDYDDAARYYEQALALDPEHLGALEYQGELFITLGQLDKAKENLARIEKACWLYCSEEGQLRDAIVAAAAQ